MANLLHVAGDILLFIATSIVLSVTLLCTVIQLRAHDADSRSFLTILIPLLVQLIIASTSNYYTSLLPLNMPAGETLRGLSLFFTIVSIATISVMLYSVSRYLIRIVNIDGRARLLGNRIIFWGALLFLLISLFSIFYVSKGDWSIALSLTLTYYPSWGSIFLLPHVGATLVFLPRAKTQEEQDHLKGIVYSFAMLVVFFPLDLIFFRDHYFKLCYATFAAFAVITYFRISSKFVREYDYERNVDGREDDFFASFALSARETEIARLLVRGMTNDEIGRSLFISVNTVRTHVKGIYEKMHVSNRVQLMHELRQFELGPV